MRRVLILIITLILVMGLCSCFSPKETTEQTADVVSNQDEISISDDIHIENAESELKKYLSYFDSDFSGIERKGIQTISNCRYVVYEAVGYDGFSYYVAIDENYDIYSGFPNSEMTLIWMNGEPTRVPAEVENYDDTPYVAYSLDIIGDSYQAYKNKIGGMFFDYSNNEQYLKYVAMNKIEGLSYYYNNDSSSIVAVDNDTVVAMAYSPRYTYNSNSGLSVRDVINAEELPSFFDAEPKIIQVDDNKCLYTWKINNGYFGIIATHASDNIYNNYAWTVILYTDKTYCSAYND